LWQEYQLRMKILCVAYTEIVKIYLIFPFSRVYKRNATVKEVVTPATQLFENSFCNE
jgi:hypothetical protein